MTDEAWARARAMSGRSGIGGTDFTRKMGSIDRDEDNTLLDGWPEIIEEYYSIALLHTMGIFFLSAGRSVAANSDITILSILAAR